MYIEIILKFVIAEETVNFSILLTTKFYI